MPLPRHRVRRHRFRRGAIAPMIAVSLPMLVIMAGFAVNLAYMELVRGQLRIACDSAAKAALVQLRGVESNSQSAACTFAGTVSANNLVANQAVSFSSSNFTFGNSTKNGSGTYVFTSRRNAQPTASR